MVESARKIHSLFSVAYVTVAEVGALCQFNVYYVCSFCSMPVTFTL